jgi:hypothetical protein
MASLPMEKSKINLAFTSQKIGCLGQSGIGKSDFFAQEDKAFFIEAEAGLNFISCYKMPARSWNDLREIYVALKEAEATGKFPYSMIVIDTIDKIVDYAEEEIVARGKEFYSKIANEINTISDLPNGAGWNKTRELVMNFISKLEQLPCAIAFISHLSIKKIEDGVRKYDKSTISLWAGMGNDMLAWADHILNVEAHMIGDKLTRTIHTKPTQSREAKSRGGVVTDGIRWGDSSKENWNNFRKLFN